MNINVIIPAGGRSQRYGAKNKLFERCKTSCVLVEAIKPFLQTEGVSKIIVGIETSYADELARELDLAGLGEERRVIFCAGGKTRTQTVRNALSSIDADADIILVHDGARPYVTADAIEAVIEGAGKYGVALPLLAMTDAIVDVSRNAEPVDRENFARVQTPFGAKRDVFEEAYKNAETAYYDDLSVIKTVFSGEICAVAGDINNIKITYAGDVKSTETNVLTGCGYDIHRLKEGDGIKLLGVQIPCEYSFVAHSDGDVPIHAIMDAILSALGKKDIGHYFPVDDPKYDGADSIELLLRVLAIAREEGYKVHNVSVTVIAENPKLAPYIDAMKTRMSQLLCITGERVGVSATTNEGVGDIGEGKSIASYASVLLEKI